MSFSISASNVDSYAIRSAVLAELEAWLQRDRDASGGAQSASVQETLPEVRDAVEAGVRAAELLARAVGEGRPDWVLNVSISGHCNPGGIPRDGWGNDFVSVSVTNASRQPATVRRELAEAEAARLEAVAEMAALSAEVGAEEATRILEAAAALTGAGGDEPGVEHRTLVDDDGEVVATTDFTGPSAEDLAEWDALTEDEQIEVLLYLDETANEGDGDDAPAADGDAGGAAAHGAGDGDDSHDVVPQGAEPEPAHEGGAAEDQVAAVDPSASTDPDLELAAYGDVGLGEVDTELDASPIAAPAGDTVIAELD